MGAWWPSRSSKPPSARLRVEVCSIRTLSAILRFQASRYLKTLSATLSKNPTSLKTTRQSASTKLGAEQMRTAIKRIAAKKDEKRTEW